MAIEHCGSQGLLGRTEQTFEGKNPETRQHLIRIRQKSTYVLLNFDR